MVAAVKGLPFICVSDPNISPLTARLIEAYGAELIIVRNRDSNGGFLGSRIELIHSMIQNDQALVWVNQYENINNVEAHYMTTGAEILRQFPHPDYIFVGAGTTGTLGGVSRYMREHSAKTKIIAVDSVGSITFGFPVGKRHIPGLGTSRVPEIHTYSSYDKIIMIEEEDTLRMCYALAKKGILLGGSTGTVLAAVAREADRIQHGACVVAISPDMGDRYVDTIYNREWIATRFPELQIDKHLSEKLNFNSTFELSNLATQ
jgi:cysteine synthase A